MRDRHAGLLRVGGVLLVVAVVFVAAAFLVDRDPRSAPTTEGEWELVFDDDFDGDELDGDRWTWCHWWDDEGCTIATNDELEWYLPQQVEVDGGMLRLTAERREVEAPDGRTFDYASGMVSSGQSSPDPERRPHFAFTYGYVEIRARVPAGRGLWPALWMLPADLESRPEIDIMEILGHDTGGLKLHFHYLDEDGERRSPGHEHRAATLSDDWHVYGLAWAPERIGWFLDGVEVWSFTDDRFIPDEPMYLVANLAVGGEYPGDPDEDTVFPATFFIDYVRVWQES